MLGRGLGSGRPLRLGFVHLSAMVQMLDEVVILLTLFLVQFLQFVSLVLSVLNLVLILTILGFELMDFLVQGVDFAHTALGLSALQLC